MQPRDKFDLNLDEDEDSPGEEDEDEDIPGEEGAIMDPRDPAFFIARLDPPLYDIAENREGWTRWKEAWEDYSTVSGLDRLLTDTAARRTASTRLLLATLRRALSESTKDVVRNLPLDDDQRRDPAQIIAALDTYVEGDTSIRVYRKQLALTTRQEGEDIDTFVTRITDTQM